MQQGCTFKPVSEHCLKVKITVMCEFSASAALCFVTFDIQGANSELVVATDNKYC